jgi:hypothetical protein
MLTNDEKKIIEKIVHSLTDYAFGDILKSREQEMIIASFILCFCFIGSLSSNRYYADPKLKNDGLKFQEFMRNYFNHKYFAIAQELYEYARSKLIHNYSTNGRFLLADTGADLHLTTIDKNIFLNIDSFIFDLSQAFNMYLNELGADENIQKKALAHYRKYRILIQQS